MARNLTRNTKVYVTNMTPAVAGTLANATNANTWEIKVLDGYTFSQATTTEDIVVEEAGATPIRGQKTFNTAQEPVDVSMTTYIRPYNNTQSLIDSPERILWASLTSSDTSDTVLDANGNHSVATVGSGIFQQASGTGMGVDFEESDSNELGKLVIWFHLEKTTYRVDNVNISTAEIDFSITDIAQIAWSGQGTSVTELPSTDHTIISQWAAGVDFKATPAVSSTSFLRNKLSTITLVNNVVQDSVDAFASGSIDVISGDLLTVDDSGIDALTINAFQDKWIYLETDKVSRKIASNTIDQIIVDKAFPAGTSGTQPYRIINDNQASGQDYTLAITGGSLTVENNMSFLTPAELGIVNQPLPGFSGARAISGNVTAYLDTGVYGTAALLKDLLEDINSVTNSYSLTLSIGGSGAASTRVDLSLATAQLAVPTIDVQDIISTDIAIAGQGSAGLLENQDELVVTYHAV